MVSALILSLLSLLSTAASAQTFNVQCGGGATDDWPVIQAAIDAAKVSGAPGLPSGIVHLLPGECAIAAPLILPRTGTTPTHVVQFEGSGPRTTRLRGLSTFPSGRALIEWDAAVSTATWHQSIRNLGFLLPSVSGTVGIHYRPNDKSTGAACLAERLQISLADLLFEGSNQYHQRFVWLEGNVIASSFTRIYGDPAQGTPAHDTLLFEFDTDDYGQEGADASGGTFCRFSEVYSAMRRGGYSGLFHGRLIRSTIDQAVGSFARSAPTLDLVRSAAVVVSSYSNEGGGSQPQVRLTDSSNITFTELGIGSPTDRGLGVGNGVELVNVRDSHFLGLWRRVGVPSFSTYGKKLLTVDSACARNAFENWTINAPMGDEISMLALESAGNYGTFYDIQHGIQYLLGQHPWLKATPP